MTITLQQTDQTPSCGEMTACASGSLSSDAQAFHADVDETPGSTQQTFQLNSEQTALTLMFQSQGLAETWPAGDWTVTINVTDAANDMTVQNVWLCRIDPSGCSTLETVSNENFDRDISAGGTHEFVLSGAESTGAESDNAYIVFEMHNAHGHTNRTVGITPDQTIQTPIPAPPEQGLSVVTNEPTDVGTDTATLEADLTYEGYGNDADMWFYYRQTIDETWTQTTPQTLSSGQTVTETVAVTESMEYEVQAQAEDTTAGVSDTGDVLTFTTPQMLAGTVVDENSTTLSGATVYVIDGDDTIVETLTTDANGEFAVEMDPGLYHVAAQYDDGTEHAGVSFHGVGSMLTTGDGGGSGAGANLANADLYIPFDDSSYENEFHSIWEDNLSTRSIVDASGRPGNQLQVELLENENYGTSMSHIHANETGSQPTHAYHRYMLRFGTDFEADTDGKLPGFGGRDDPDTDEGSGGDPSTGDGWSTRAGWNQPGGDRIDPTDPIPLEYYIYHMDMSGSYGDHDSWDDGEEHFEAERETWYEIEQEIDLGQPNTNDGVLRAWVDGDLVYERTDLRFRDENGNDISRSWFDIFHGGGAPATVELHFDDFYIHRDGVP